VSSVRVYGKGFIVEVPVNENEPVDVAIRKFNIATKASKVMYDGRRRNRFENKQDIIKRKEQERGTFKDWPDEEDWTDHMGILEPSPFSDMFGAGDDIFEDDIEGDIDFESMLEPRSSPTDPFQDYGLL
jgi:ribosomal protein S21